MGRGWNTTDHLPNKTNQETGLREGKNVITVSHRRYEQVRTGICIYIFTTQPDFAALRQDLSQADLPFSIFLSWPSEIIF